MSQKEIEQVRSKIQEEDVFDEAGDEIDKKLDHEKVDQLYNSNSATDDNPYDWNSKNELYKYYFLNTFMYYPRGINTYGTVTRVKPDDNSIVLTIEGIDETLDGTGIIKTEEREIRIDPSDKTDKSKLDYLISSAGVNKPSDLVGESVPISSEKTHDSSRRIALYEGDTLLHRACAKGEHLSRRLGLIRPHPNGEIIPSVSLMFIGSVICLIFGFGLIQAFGFNNIIGIFAIIPLIFATGLGTIYILIFMFRLVMGLLSYATDENSDFIQDWSR